MTGLQILFDTVAEFTISRLVAFQVGARGPATLKKLFLPSESNRMRSGHAVAAIPVPTPSLAGNGGGTGVG